VGEVTKRENAWQDRATAAAIAAARRIVLGDRAVIPMMTPVGRLSDVEWGCGDRAVIPMMTPVGRLSDVEWGWIVAGVLFAWIGVRGEQATVEGRDVEEAIRDGVDGAWDVGAIATILPELGEAPGIDWTKPLAGWPRDQMIAFLSNALSLAQHAMAARDRGCGVTRKSADAVLTV
jgi:hypothetical protein